MTNIITAWHGNAFRVTDLCDGKPQVTCGFLSQMPVILIVAVNLEAIPNNMGCQRLERWSSCDIIIMNSQLNETHKSIIVIRLVFRNAGPKTWNKIKWIKNKPDACFCNQFLCPQWHPLIIIAPLTTRQFHRHPQLQAGALLTIQF